MLRTLDSEVISQYIMEERKSQQFLLNLIKISLLMRLTWCIHTHIYITLKNLVQEYDLFINNSCDIL